MSLKNWLTSHIVRSPKASRTVVRRDRARKKSPLLVELLESRECPAVTITEASGGTGLSDLAFHPLGSIVITETLTNDITTVGTPRTILVSPPTGWQFNAGVGTVTSSGNDFTTTFAIGANNILITLAFDSPTTDELDVITISGLEVQATSPAAADGNIMRTGGTLSAISGLTTNVTSLGALSLTGVIVTPGTGGTNLSDLNFHTLTDIVLTEADPNGFAPTGTDPHTFILTAPVGWEFNPGIGTLAGGDSGDFSGFIDSTSYGGATLSVTTDKISITVDFDTSPLDEIDILTISGIQVRATSLASQAGLITRRTDDAGSVGVSAGVVTTNDARGAGGTNFGILELNSVEVTPATGGTGITDLSFHTLGDITLDELGRAGFNNPSTNPHTLILTAPAGWEFNPTVGALTGGEANDFLPPGGATLTVDATTITISVNFDALPLNEFDTLVLSGIEVKATSAASAPGQIYRRTSSPGTIGITLGVDTTDNTDGAGGTNFGSLSASFPAPTVSSVGVSDTLITDANTPGDATFIVTIEFSIAMTIDGSADPTLTFSPLVASTLTFDALASGWLDSDTYVAKYDVADGDFDADEVTIDVSGAKSSFGVDQEDYTPENEFAIDTENPSVISVSVNDTTITDADVGSKNFQVTVVFSESMDTGTPPTLEFSQDVSATLEFECGYWTQTTVPNDTYVAKYNVSDAGVKQDDIVVTAGGAKDVAGNEDPIATNVFDIDTENPTLTSFIMADTTLNFGETSLVTITFSEKVKNFSDADFTIPNGILTNLTTSDCGQTWTATYTPNAGVLDATNVLTINLATLNDKACNPGSGTASTANFTIDTRVPTKLAITSAVPTAMFVNTNLPAIKVQIRDAANNNLPVKDRTITLTLRNSAGTIIKTFSGKTNASGWITFPAFKITTAGVYYLEATTPGLAKAKSNNISVVSLPFTG